MWRFVEPVALTLTRKQADAVREALLYHTEEVYKYEPEQAEPFDQVLAMMMVQIERRAPVSGASK